MTLFRRAYREGDFLRFRIDLGCQSLLATPGKALLDKAFNESGGGTVVQFHKSLLGCLSNSSELHTPCPPKSI
ncbi:hypothetical protein PSP6_800010 [Paraburkholderia tropica]|nr:hypothetical protein PSP6_800010 [Paraburkholderia tropica]